MIYVDRTRVPKPRALDPEVNEKLSEERAQAERYFSNSEELRGQRRFNFRAHLDREIKERLRELFHQKCCYCEVKLDKVEAVKKFGTSGDIEHYRPKSGVVEAPDHSGYWWLASTWENLLIACPHCNRGGLGIDGKGNRFPLVDESTRCSSPEDDLSKEMPLILNPCEDDPSDHLVFTDNGMVYSETKRGQASILVLGLNRDDLVERRKEVIKRIDLLKGMLNSIQASISNKILPGTDSSATQAELNKLLLQIKELTEESQEFAGLKRQYVRALLEELNVSESAPEIKSRSKHITINRQESVKSSYESYAKELGNLDLESSGSEPGYLLTNHYVTKVELTNIKTFTHQVFDLSKSIEQTAPWTMLLGENGAGKSTVLKSICLNLCDQQYFVEAIEAELFDPDKFIRHGTETGIIKVWLSGMTKPRTLELRKGEYTFISSGGEKITIRKNSKVEGSKVWKSKTFLLAYGATRLLPRGTKSEEIIIKNDFVRVDNLFNPFVPLGDAEKWLSELSPKLFRRAALIFKDLLNLGEEENLEREGNQVLVKINDQMQPLHELSDGYQSVMALTSDVLQLAMHKWTNPDEARGVVLLDEVGAHLHPQWKMKIVGSLRKALPNMQFIVSSHQPLCLRGIGKGEVMILRRDEEMMVEVLTELPDPKELRISQILTSVFGLRSTMDPELEAEYNRFYELKAKHKLTQEEEDEMAELEEVLRPDLMLGESLLDSQAYKVVKEQYQQFKQSDDQSDIDKLSENTLSAVKSLWSS